MRKRRCAPDALTRYWQLQQHHHRHHHHNNHHRTARIVPRCFGLPSVGLAVSLTTLARSRRHYVRDWCHSRHGVRAAALPKETTVAQEGPPPFPPATPPVPALWRRNSDSNRPETIGGFGDVVACGKSGPRRSFFGPFPPLVHEMCRRGDKWPCHGNTEP